MTKLLVALAALDSVQRGLLDLDEPAGPPGATVAHLLAHASGLGLDGDTVLSQPGRRRIYSNRGIEIVAGLIAARARKPFDRVLADEICLPLGLHGTRLEGSPAWGAVGPLADLMTLAIELVSPSLVDEDLLARATAVAFPGLPGVVPGFGRQPRCDWGLGFEIKDSKAPHWTGRRNSPATFGHFGRAWQLPVGGPAGPDRLRRRRGPGVRGMGQAGVAAAVRRRARLLRQPPRRRRPAAGWRNAMTLIALEEHVLPAYLANAVWTPDLPQATTGRPGIRAALADITETRLPAMDAAGIDVQVLSPVAPGPQGAGPKESVTLTRQLNDTVAAIVREHPGRFRALASLPTPDPGSAVREARRAVGELGMCGVIVNGHTHGRFLDAPEFAPMLAAIEDLRVPMYLHPTYPPAAVAAAYYSGLEPAAAAQLATAGWGWHAETGLHVLRMAVGGVFDRHPGLQVVIGHMGENLPFSLMRADSVLSRHVPGPRPLADVVRDHVSITICGYATVPPLLCALSVFGADRILFSADYPFGDPVQHAEFLAGAPISPADREKIAHLNAERLFAL